MIARRGIPFPVQRDTENRTEINPIERVENTQGLTQEATFDYERALPPEKSSLQVDVVEKDIILNPQPKTPPLISVFQKMGIIAERPIAKRIVADQLDFANKFSSQVKIASTFPESIPSHQKAFPPPERKTEHPQSLEGQVGQRESMNFLDKFFHWLNSVLGE